MYICTQASFSCNNPSRPMPYTEKLERKGAELDTVISLMLRWEIPRALGLGSGVSREINERRSCGEIMPLPL